MKDATASEIERVTEAADKCMAVLSLRGYARIETPIVEETELFLRKSGGELSSRLYDFEEPGGFRTSLRPEFTSPVIRYAIENGEAASNVCRYQYFGPVFRYATPEHSDKTRQFNQLGAELIGVPAPRGDGEVIAMALEGLRVLEAPPVTIALGHVGLLRQLLKKFQLSERAIQFLLSQAALIADGKSDDVESNAAQLGLLGDERLSVVDAPESREQIEAVLDRSMGPLGPNAGTRTRAEVIARLARKQTYADDPAKFRSALSMLRDLMSVTGNTTSTFDEGRKLASSAGLDDRCFTLLESVILAALDEGVSESSISIRYGLARGVAYYTGMLFDVLPDPAATGSLGGGGRYDGLTRALGLEEEVPALGFAFSLDEVVKLIGNNGNSDSARWPVVVRPATDDAWKAALKTASELRQQGRAAVVQSGDKGVDGAEVVVVDASGRRISQTGRSQ